MLVGKEKPLEGNLQIFLTPWLVSNLVHFWYRYRTSQRLDCRWWSLLNARCRNNIVNLWSWFLVWNFCTFSNISSGSHSNMCIWMATAVHLILKLVWWSLSTRDLFSETLYMFPHHNIQTLAYKSTKFCGLWFHCATLSARFVASDYLLSALRFSLHYTLLAERQIILILYIFIWGFLKIEFVGNE